MNDFYAQYTEAFLRGIADYARVSAAVDDGAEPMPVYITISQRLEAESTPLIMGLAISLDAFYALASHYSGVSLEGMDELAVDAVGELFNVINGHFSSAMRARTYAVSIIDPPRHHHGAAAPDAPEFLRAVTSPVGTMQLMAARTEFIAARTEFIAAVH